MSRMVNGKIVHLCHCGLDADIKYGWADDEGRPCFAWYCQPHYIEARNKYQATGNPPSIDDIFPAATEDDHGND